MNIEGLISRRNRASCLLTALLALALPLAARQAAAGACSKSAEETLQFSRREARAAYWLARAKCTNLPLADQIDCLAEAQTTLIAALELADDQYDERLDVCLDLGGSLYDPEILPGNFVVGVSNPYLPLQPGLTLVYAKNTSAGVEHIEVGLTGATRLILGVACLEVHDVVTLNGERVEDTLDYYAQDLAGNVWYFGELAMNFEDNQLANLDGSWRAGIDGAKPGIVMKAVPQIGDLYRQEFLIGEAEDLAEVRSLNRAAFVPYATFLHCLQTEDFTPIDPGIEEHKYYAPGVGMVLSINLQTGARTELVEIRP